MRMLLCLAGALLVAVLVNAPTGARSVAAQPAGFVCDGSPGVYLYEGLNFTGRCLRFVANEPDLSALGFNNVASSLRIVGPYSAQLHADPAFRGPWTGFRGDDPNLADDIIGDNRATSVQVQRR
jgi:hypothetical protein